MLTPIGRQGVNSRLHAGTRELPAGDRPSTPSGWLSLGQAGGAHEQGGRCAAGQPDEATSPPASSPRSRGGSHILRRAPRCTGTGPSRTSASACLSSRYQVPGTHSTSGSTRPRTASRGRSTGSTTSSRRAAPGPLRPHLPSRRLVLGIAVEHIHHGAEIGLLRDLRRGHARVQPPPIKEEPAYSTNDPRQRGQPGRQCTASSARPTPSSRERMRSGSASEHGPGPPGSPDPASARTTVPRWREPSATHWPAAPANTRRRPARPVATRDPRFWIMVANPLRQRRLLTELLTELLTGRRAKPQPGARPRCMTWAFNEHPQRGSNPCLHLESVMTRVVAVARPPRSSCATSAGQK
jgi:hypothetical protein